MTPPHNCPKCGEPSISAEFLDTGTDSDFYELQCPNGHVVEYEIDNQTEEFIEIEDDDFDS